MIVLGIDPGFASLGYVLADTDDPNNLGIIAAGTIKTKKDKSSKVLARDSNVARFLQIYSALRSLSDCKLDWIFVEGMSQPRDASASWKLALGWGAVLSVVAEHSEAGLKQISPMTIKKHVCNNPSASKDQMIAAIRRLAPDLVWPKNKGDHEHMADAIGAMLSGLALVATDE